MHTFIEATEKTAVFTYGRNNPPTIGHEKLFDKTVETAKKHGAVPHIFTSHSQDAKKNPLTAEHKVQLIKHAYPQAHVGSSSKEMPSMLHIAKQFHEQGHKHLVMVAGSDRVEEYKQKLKQYNGTHEGALYNFKSIKVVSAGERDPDAEGASGMSGTKLRSHAIAGNKEKFKSGLMSKLSDEHKEKVYNTVRKALKVEEIYDPHLKISKYQWGEKEGVDHMKKMTPGEKANMQPALQTFRKKIKENQIPVLLMTAAQRAQLQEEATQLEFDGIQTKNLDMCADAYKQFKVMIETIRSGKHIGEPTGHEPDVMAKGSVPELAKRPAEIAGMQAANGITPSSNVQRQVAAGIAMKPAHLRRMQFKQYTGL